MQTTYVREFLVVADTLNYAEAAKRLYTSHSSLFKHIKTLEDDIGGSLFEREGHSISLSEFGQEFLPHARRLIEDEDWCLGDLAKWKADSNESITFTADYRIVDLVTQFHRKYPHYIIHNLEKENRNQSIQMLSKGEIDAALLCDEGLDPELFDRIPFAVDTMAIVLPVRHSLAGETAIRLEQLKNENFIMLPTESRHFDYCRRAFADAHFTPRISMICARGDAVVQNIVDSGGCSIMMKKLTMRQNEGKIAIVPLEPEIEVHVDLWVRKNRRRSMAVQDFIRFVRQKIEESESEKKPEA
ncbi:MAG: LysR family transcriptional regulator [Lachnospiraceae bacterium]|nr:LysR family transcriptional regulator [Lachnospiraceae bacterium]